MPESVLLLGVLKFRNSKCAFSKVGFKTQNFVCNFLRRKRHNNILFPKEFFPGDFVLAANDAQANSSFRDYGVIQNVDHLGRTALVKWFSTYTSMEEPKYGKFNKNHKQSFTNILHFP
jgi:hypothetical protein